MSTNAVNSDTDVRLLPCLDDNIAMIQSALGGSPDLIVKGFKWGDQWRAALLFIDGMVDLTQMHEMIVEPLLSVRKDEIDFEQVPGIYALHALKDNVLSAANVSVVEQPAMLFNSMFSGDADLLMD